MKIYGDHHSGNCYKIKMTLSLLGMDDYQWEAIDLLKGETKNDTFRAINPAEEIPVVVFKDGRILSQSNAIINYLARRSHLIPKDDFLYAKVQQWQFFEQYSHEPYIAGARYINRYLGLPPTKQKDYEAKQQPGHRALAVMEKQLSSTPYLTGQQFTTADISLYAYTHIADEGGFDLSAYTAIHAWFARIQAQPNYTAMSAE